MRIHNTLTGRKEEFVLQGDVLSSSKDEMVRMYVCGVTPYDECHIGHAMSYIFFDVLRRYLEFRGYRVKHVQNFTDVDDKIISRAQEKGVPAAELAQGFMQRYFEDMDALNIQRATHYPQATQVIPEILEMVQGLVAKGYAYVVGGDVYFRVQRFPGYGKLSHRTLEGMQAGARLDIAEVKEHPMDFALWKAAKPGEPSWESPWGPGRPGWHIECSAMSLKYLGETLDIHGGGQDLIFPHHENEIAQSEAFTGVAPFVRYWVHNGMVQLGSEKMSKSLGNLVTVREVLKRWGSDALRLFVLSSHYRSPLTYSEEGLDAAERGVERLHTAVKESDGGGAFPGPEAESFDPSTRLLRQAQDGVRAPQAQGKPYRQRFVEAMEDDLNTSQAQAVLFDLARDINRGRDEGRDVSQLLGLLKELSGVLGLTLKETQKAFEPDLVFRQGVMKIYVEVKSSLEPSGFEMRHHSEADAVNSVIGTLMEARTKLREAKQWQKADGIRTQLAELGIALEDTTQGTLWRYRR